MFPLEDTVIRCCSNDYCPIKLIHFAFLTTLSRSRIAFLAICSETIIDEFPKYLSEPGTTCRDLLDACQYKLK